MSVIDPKTVESLRGVVVDHNVVSLPSDDAPDDEADRLYVLAADDYYVCVGTATSGRWALGPCFRACTSGARNPFVTFVVAALYKRARGDVQGAKGCLEAAIHEIRDAQPDRTDDATGRDFLVVVDDEQPQRLRGAHALDVCKLVARERAFGLILYEGAKQSGRWSVSTADEHTISAWPAPPAEDPRATLARYQAALEHIANGGISPAIDFARRVLAGDTVADAHRRSCGQDGAP